jgi:hypothetical protein
MTFARRPLLLTLFLAGLAASLAGCRAAQSAGSSVWARMSGACCPEPVECGPPGGTSEVYPNPCGGDTGIGRQGTGAFAR